MTAMTCTSSTSRRYLKQNSLELLQEYKQFPQESTRNQIVQLNMGLVRREVHRWMNKCPESYDDLLQVGSLGLIKAIERFDLTKGCALSSFAIPYIRGEILHYLRDKSLPIRIPRQYSQLKIQAAKVTVQLREKLHRKPTDAEIAETLGISIEKWNQVRLADNNSSLLSLDATCKDEFDEKTSLGELIIDPNFSQLKMIQEDKIDLEIALSKLTSENRYILESVFFRNLTYKEVAKQLGVSMITISRRVQKSLKELKLLLQNPEEVDLSHLSGLKSSNCDYFNN